MNTTDNASFPPPGWVTNREAAQRLGVAFDTLTCGSWRWLAMLRQGTRTVRHPNRGRCNIYSIDQIERIIALRQAAAVPQIPPGLVDKEGACAFFGVSRFVWKTWIRQGKVGCGRIIPSPVGGRQKVYAIEDLRRLREELFGEDKLYRLADGTYHVPADFIGREEAWGRFGVGKSVWERWHSEGRITCGQRVPGGPRLYRVEEIEALLDEYGRWSPPYPDPDRPGALRVPLGGRDIKRREAIIDAGDLPRIEGGSCTWSQTGKWCFVAFSKPGDAEQSGIPLRRIILGITESGLNVRHVNGDPLDCRRENLVVRTIAQRAYNTRKIASRRGQPCTSRFKGVCWDAANHRWIAQIKLKNRNRKLGRFRDEIAAAVAYDEAAREWFGEHARLNFPDGVDAWLATSEFAPAQPPQPAPDARQAA